MTGAILMGVGGAIGLAGFTVAGFALFTATRQWVAAMDVPPSEMARRHWNRARAAALAGAGAWRDGQPGSAPGS